MDQLVITGGRPLSGTIAVSGAKNSVLACQAAALLTGEEVVLENAPDVADLSAMCQVLSHLGCRYERASGRLTITPPEKASAHEAPYDLVRKMRASVLVLGPLVARHGKARVSLPGGCAIGARPVNLHIDALEKLGASISVEHGYIVAEAKRLKGAEIFFDTVTVGGTENALMAATLAEGITTIQNAAREPEIVDLAAMLSQMGARIEGAGSSTITVEGVETLSGCRHPIIPDRIEAGTALIAGALLGEPLTVQGAWPEHNRALIDKLRECGAQVEEGEKSVTVRRASGSLKAVALTTAPFPGFPTDLQAQMMALLTQAEGAATVTETIFENRFMHAPELARLGAQITVSGRNAVVTGPTRLGGATVMASDLRASATLVVAGLVAAGETTVRRIYHLDRGYDRLEQKFAAVGARIVRSRES